MSTLITISIVTTTGRRTQVNINTEITNPDEQKALVSSLETLLDNLGVKVAVPGYGQGDSNTYFFKEKKIFSEDLFNPRPGELAEDLLTRLQTCSPDPRQ